MTAHGVNERDLQAIAYLVARLRAETYGANTWDEAGIHAKLKPMVGRNLATTLEQVLRHAGDATAKTPGAIHRNFTPPPSVPTRRGNPKPGEDCPEHAGQWPDNCAGCKTKRYGDDDPASPDLPPLAEVNPRLAQRIAARRGDA